MIRKLKQYGYQNDFFMIPKVSSMSSAIFLLPTLTSGGSGDNGMTHIGGVEGKDCVKNEGRKENKIVKV